MAIEAQSSPLGRPRHCPSLSSSLAVCQFASEVLPSWLGSPSFPRRFPRFPPRPLGGTVSHQTQHWHAGGKRKEAPASFGGQLATEGAGFVGMFLPCITTASKNAGATGADCRVRLTL